MRVIPVVKCECRAAVGDLKVFLDLFQAIRPHPRYYLKLVYQPPWLDMA